MGSQQSISLLCLASEFKGVPFIEEAKRLGCHITLVVKEEFAEDPWPRDAIDQFFPMPILWKQPDITYGISWLARSRRFDQIIALDDYDVETVADLREHLRLPGMGHTVTRFFRDKLAMRMQARAAGIPAPAFTPVFNDADLAAWMANTPSPWALKPRFEAGAVGIQKLNDSEAVWGALAELGDKRAFFLLEAFLPGAVFHVDSIIWDGEVGFNSVSKYGLPPLSVSHGGGVFSSRTLPASHPDSQTISRLTQRLMTAFGMQQGVAHTEFIQGTNGTFHFLETAARVGGANLDKLVYAASGVNLWAEMAKIAVADVRGEAYETPKHKGDNAGILTCLAKQQHPDLSGYNDPEIIWRLDKPYHAGLIVASPSPERVEDLLDNYVRRFGDDFMTVGALQETMRQ